MNLLNKDLNLLIQLRKSRFKNWLIGLTYLNCLQIFIKFFLMGTIGYFEFSEYIMKGTIFYLFNNLGQFNQTNFIFSLFPLYSIVCTYIIVYKSDDLVWDPLFTSLIRDNWNQFLENNFDHRPTFFMLRMPIQTLKIWKLVIKKLQNYRKVHFSHQLRLFPYMDRQIRAKVLYNLLMIEMHLNFLFQLCCKHINVIKIFLIRANYNYSSIIHLCIDLYPKQIIRSGEHLMDFG